MRTLFLVVALAAALFTQSCATTANYEKSLQPLVGLEEADLVRKWGAPQESYEKGDRKFLVYASYRNVYFPTAPNYQSAVQGNTVIGGQAGGAPQVMAFTCITTFEVSEGRIVAYRFQGNDCLAR